MLAACHDQCGLASLGDYAVVTNNFDLENNGTAVFIPAARFDFSHPCPHMHRIVSSQRVVERPLDRLEREDRSIDEIEFAQQAERHSDHHRAMGNPAAEHRLCREFLVGVQRVVITGQRGKASDVGVGLTCATASRRRHRSQSPRSANPRPLSRLYHVITSVRTHFPQMGSG